MFSSYDLTCFGARMREIRLCLNYTQKNISDLSGINIDTLRRLENGLTLPRFDTLEHLSIHYKINVAQILDKYKESTFLLTYYYKVEHLITCNNPADIIRIQSEFIVDLKNRDIQLIDSYRLNQFSLFLEGLKLSYSNNETILMKALSILTIALKLTIPTFKIDNFQAVNYNNFEYRVLFLVASLLGRLDQSHQSNIILLTMLRYFEKSIHGDYQEKRMMSKVYSLICYNYFRQDDHKKTIDYADLGIRCCLENELFTNLHILYIRRGISLYILEDENYMIPIHNAINIVKILGDLPLLESYKNILFNRYGITV